MVDVDTKPYYDAGRACQETAGHLKEQLGTLRGTLNSCGSMAGDYADVATWASTYDSKTTDFLSNAESVINALANFGDVVNAAGYNWDLANHNSNSNPNKGAPPVRPAQSLGRFTAGCAAPPPSAKGSNGDGLDTDIPGLLAKIGIPVPDGDASKLASAATAWRNFGSNEHVSEADRTLQTMHDGFSHVTTDDAQHIQAHLATLKGAVTALSSYSTAMSGPVNSHQSALQDLRTDVKHDTHELVIALGIAAAAVIISIAVVAFTGGASLAITGESASAAALLIARTGTAIRDLITTSRLVTAVLTVGGAAAATAAFGKVDGLTATAALSHIAMLTAQTIDDEPGNSKANPQNPQRGADNSQPPRPEWGTSGHRDQLPKDGDMPYVPPKEGHGSPHKVNDSFIDEKGRKWTWDQSRHGGEHWDVVDKRDRNHVNVYPDGHIRKG